MQIIQADLSKVDASEIEIIPMADLHIGDPLSDWSLINERIQYIKNTPHAYCILDGDLMDNGTRQSIGDVYQQTYTPNDAIKLLVRLLEPIKDKILAACPGNHEARTYRVDGIDITDMICSQLGISDRYSPTTAFLIIKTAKASYSMYITHGSGGGRKAGGKVNRLLDLAQITDADIYVMGHTHTPTVTRQAKMDHKNGKAVRVEQLFVITAAALQYGGYADIQGYAPASMINPVIHLMTMKKFAYAIA